MENLLYHGNGNTLHDLPTFPPLQQLPYPLLFPTLLSPASYCSPPPPLPIASILPSHPPGHHVSKAGTVGFAPAHLNLWQCLPLALGHSCPV